MSTLIKYETEIEQVFPFVTDKMVVDMLNGLSIANALNKSNMSNQGFLKRFMGLISGKTQQSQANINDNMLYAFDSTYHYILENLKHQEAHTHALIQVNETLKHTQFQMAEIVDYVVELQQKVSEEIETRIDRLEDFTYALSQMNNVLARQRNGKFNELSPMGQSYAMLDSLYRGDFGLFLRTTDNQRKKDELLDTLENEMLSNLKNYLNVSSKENLPQSIWLNNPVTDEKTDSLNQVLTYQGNWSLDNRCLST